MRRLSLLVLSVVALQCWGAASASTVGRTQGQFGVSATGAATYTIPIFAPPGPQGVQPQIALVYDSQSGMGPEGTGWSVSGLSSISRCNLTVAQDGVPAAVALAYSDVFCLDGQRLRLTSSEDLSTYGHDGTTYQTEVANFSSVTAHGQTGLGPTYFTVQGRNGWTYEYGNTTDSRVIPSGSATASSWMLDKVTDRYLNTMTIVWEAASANLTGMTVPENISWTQGQYTMAFNYAVESAPVVYGYLGGTVVQSNYLLQNVYVYGQQVGFRKNYVLGYTGSPTTGQSTLTSVTECVDPSQATCLYPTKMTYQPGQKGVATGTPITLPASSFRANDTLYSAFDLNGDGINDLAYYDSGMWYVAFGSVSGYSAAISTGITDPLATLGNIDASGSAAIVVNQNTQWWYYKWNANAQTFAGTYLAPAPSHDYSPTLTDLNGDGLADLIYIDASTSHLNVLYNTSTSTGVSFGSPTDAGSVGTLAAVKGAFGSQAKLDFTGDGQGDLLGVYAYDVQGAGYANYYVLHFSGGPYPSTFTSTELASAVPATTGSAVDVGDYNDDGCMDLLFENQLIFSGCNGTSSTSIGLDYPAVGGINWDGGARRAVLADDQGELVEYDSLGNTLASPVDTGIAFNSSNAYISLPNPTGDGLDALGVFNQTSSPASIKYYLHNGAGQPSDLLTSVTDGYGNSASPAYVSIAQSSYAGTADAVYPYANYAGPLYVVNNVIFSDPSSTTPGATYSTGYSYTGAWMNLQGRGFSGFNSVRRTDTRTVPLASPNGLTETTYYERAFPYTGMMFEDTVANGSSSVSDTTQTPTCTPLPSCTPPALDSTAWNQRYFAYFPTVVTQQWELNGSENTDLITTKSTTYATPDIYGNFKTITQAVTENDPGAPTAYQGLVWTTTVSNSYADGSANWCVSLLTQQTVAYSSTDGGAPVTRTTGFTPDTVKCHYTEKVTEPAGSTYSPTYTVTEDLAYDGFGNLYTDTVTGYQMAPRQTKIEWNSTGQFPQNLYNALNQKTTLTYDPFWGTRTSVADPNGIPQQWTYDPSFGRLAQVLNANGTSTKLAYSDCASTCLFGAHGMVVGTTVYNTDQSVMTDGTDYYDPIDRPLVSTRRQLENNTYSRNDTRYDSMGNVSWQSAPCAWVNIGSVCPSGTTFVHDALNRQTSAQLQSTDLPTTTWSYSGDTVVQQDPGGNKRKLINDSAGRFRQAVDANGYAVIMSYDAAGSLTERTDSLGRTLWTSGTSLSGPGAIQYGIAPFTINATDLARGTRTTKFNALGERVGLTDANGNITAWAYDALSRATSRAETDAADTNLNFFTQWNWDGAANGIGKLQSVCTLTGGSPQSCLITSGGYSESYGYDGAGRLQQQSIVIPGPNTFNYSLTYNSSGLLGTLTYPTTVGSPLQIQYGYNNGLLQSVVDVNDSVTVWTANTETPAGQVTLETLGNSVVVNRTFDSTSLQLKAITAAVGNNPPLENQRYLYFPTGTVEQRLDGVAGLTETLSYDSLNRLYTSQLVNHSGTSNNLQMCYDNTGSSCSETAAGPGLITSKTADTAPPVSYSATWTPYNYPGSISSSGESVSFSYGPDRQRWQQNYNSGAEITNYIGRLLEQVTTSAGTSYRHYIYAGAEPVAIFTPGSPTNKLEYMLSDDEGSISALVNSNGTTDVNESFTAYGARRNPATGMGAPSSSDLTTIAGITRQGYTFQTALGQSMGLNHMNGRVQDAITGQFLSPDPHIPDPTNTQDYNRYSYVDNNPMTLVDPTGFDSYSGRFFPEPSCLSFFVGGSWNGNGVWDQGNDGQVQIICQKNALPGPQFFQPPTGGIGGIASSGGGGPAGGAPSPSPKSPQVPCVRPAVRVAQGIIGGIGVIAGAAQAVGGFMAAFGGVVGAPETGGVSLLAVGGGVANATLGAAAFADGAKMVIAAFNGSGATESSFDQIGQQYGGQTGRTAGQLVDILSQVVSAAMSPAKTAEAAITNVGAMGLGMAIPGCGR